MQPQTGRFPLWRIAFGNTVVMSSAYLAAAIYAELSRRYLGMPSSDVILRVLETLPARILSWVGAWDYLREKYVFGVLNEMHLRLVLGATMVLLIFAVAVCVTALLWVVRRPHKKSPLV